MAMPAMQSADGAPGPGELVAARLASRPAIYMLQVYDRVLASRSGETLVALTLLMACLFLVMGVLDHARGRIMARVGARMQRGLDQRVLSAAFHRLTVAPQDVAALAAQRDLDAIARPPARNWSNASGPTAIIRLRPIGPHIE